MSNAIEAAKIIKLNEKDLELSFLPLSHTLERTVYYALILSGSSIAYAEGFEKISRNLQEIKATVLVSVPRIYEKIYMKIKDGVKSAGPNKQKIFEWSVRLGKSIYDIKKLGAEPGPLLELENYIAQKMVYRKVKEKIGPEIRILISGGAPLMREIAEFFTYIGLPILEGYGLTETSPVLTLNRPDNFRFGSVGQAIPGVEIKIAEDGEILARGPNIMKGYYNNPQATDEVIESDGWFHTGDIGELDNENFLKITDRKKELIVMSNGKNVAPQPIECILKNSAYIEQAAIIGDNRKYIAALIVPEYKKLSEKARELGIKCDNIQELCSNKEIHDFVRNEIDHLCRNKLANYERVKRFSLLEREFSLENNEITPTLKLKRKIISENFKMEIELLYHGELASA